MALTPLYVAAQNGHTEVVKMLLKKMLMLIKRVNVMEKTALHSRKKWPYRSSQNTNSVQSGKISE